VLSVEFTSGLSDGPVTAPGASLLGMFDLRDTLSFVSM
jgi:hypothetical protein